MPDIRVVDRGRIDESDSAFPKAVELPDGEILCSYGVGGGPNVTGHTEFSSSSDGGRTWQRSGVILEKGTDPPSCNFLKLCLHADGRTLFAYGSRLYRSPGDKFGQGSSDAVYCTSTDGGRSWSDSVVIDTGLPGSKEISFSMVPLSSGRLLAPMATLPKGRLGERVLAYISDDAGRNWARAATVFHDPEGRRGFFEHKFTEFAPGSILATAWTVTLATVEDLPDSYAISTDDGETWTPFRSTGVAGQTMTPVSLGGNRLLVLYNKRTGDQCIVMNLVEFSHHAWTIVHQGVLYDNTNRPLPGADTWRGVDSFDDFAFGFPTAIALANGQYLATYWSKERGVFGISWALLEIDWP